MRCTGDPGEYGGCELRAEGGDLRLVPSAATHRRRCQQRQYRTSPGLSMWEAGEVLDGSI